MIINRHDCIQHLIELDNGDTAKDSELLLSTILADTALVINKEILDFFIENKVELPVVDFYKLLNNKAHPIIKQMFDSEGKEVFHFIKLATSIITQATITLEHQFKDNIKGANDFINNIGLPQLSDSLSTYFSTGDFVPLLKNLEKNKEDIKLILN